MKGYTRSTKRARWYKHKFDHEKAREMWEKGFNYGEIARHLGVSQTAIVRILDPKTQARMKEQSLRWAMSGVCPQCGGPMRRYQTIIDGRRNTGLCRKCSNDKKQTRFHLDADGNVLEIHCPKCQLWKPVDQFTRVNNRSRGFRTHCRSCDTQNRQRSREKRKLPCVGCGRPALHPADKGKNGADVPRCRSCAHKMRREASAQP